MLGRRREMIVRLTLKSRFTSWLLTLLLAVACCFGVPVARVSIERCSHTRTAVNNFSVMRPSLHDIFVRIAGGGGHWVSVQCSTRRAAHPDSDLSVDASSVSFGPLSRPAEWASGHRVVVLPPVHTGRHDAAAGDSGRCSGLGALARLSGDAGLDRCGHVGRGSDLSCRDPASGPASQARRDASLGGERVGWTIAFCGLPF
jgi:hypothetical protein